MTEGRGGDGYGGGLAADEPTEPAGPPGGRAPELIDRPRLVTSLRGLPARVSQVAVVAPPGYGKTSVLRQWEAVETRPFVWLSCLESHPAGVVERLKQVVHGRPSGEHEGLRSHRDALPRSDGRVVVVVDDFHVVDTPAVGTALRSLIEGLPSGVVVVVASRLEPGPTLGFARAEIDETLARVGAEDLALSFAEASRLFEAAGVAITKGELRSLMEDTGGWPAAVSLAARRGARGVDGDAPYDTGEIRALLHRYIEDEVLRPLPRGVVESLRRCSVLDRLAAPLCDAVLDTEGSVAWLDALADRQLLFGSFDGDLRWLRPVPLVRSVLRAQFRAVESHLEGDLHRRASRWMADNSDLGGAISHARSGKDEGRVTSLLWGLRSALSAPKAELPIDVWLSTLSDDEIGRSPQLAMLAAWSAFINADLEGCDRYTAVTVLALETTETDDAASIEAWLRLISAARARDLDGLLRNTEAGSQPADQALRAFACALSGAALRLNGSTAAARARLEEGVEVALAADPAMESVCRAQLALMAKAEGAAREAELQVKRAARVLDDVLISQRPVQALVYATAALVNARVGATKQARTEVKWARYLLGNLGDLVPWLAIETRIVLAEAALHLGSIGEARELLDEASSLLEASPSFASLGSRLEALSQRLGDAELPLGLLVTPLTPAEARVLRHLPTHLTFAEIAEQLFVSRNTVKTQAIAAYRKLGVTSRREAVERSRAVGLLP